MTAETTHYVVRTDAGGWRVVDSRVSLDSVVLAYRNGSSAEQIIIDFPSLTLEIVHGALAFYFRHRAEIDRYLEQQEERWAAFRNESEAKNEDILQRFRSKAQLTTPKGGSA